MMPVGETFHVALDALRVNKLRSVLTMLGIVIGVSAVIAMVALGRGAQNSVNERIAALGTTLLTVIPGQLTSGGIASGTDRAPLTYEDAQAVMQNAQLVAAVEPEMARQLQIEFQGRNASTQVIGTTANYLDVRRYAIATGRMFTDGDDEGRRRVAVLGQTVVNNLGTTQDAVVGQSMRIQGIQFTAVGVLAPKGGASSFSDPDDEVLIPLNTARFRVLDTKNLRSISVLAPSESLITPTINEVDRILRRAHHILPGRPSDFQVRNQADFLSTFAQTTQSFTLLLAGIAAVSLLVGGIGIMNIMLVSVTERTREVGIRKALGATRANILLQFLIEAVVLSLFGGLIGVALGAGGAILMRQAFHWSTAVSTSSVVLAFVFSALVGIIFGVWPARRAAGLDPIASLRYE